jgi:phosphoglycolate phosphatase-like HAD superfamily hydrolase
VRAGQVDAISHHEPVMSMLEHKADVRIIADTRSLRGSLDVFGGPTVGPCLFAPSEFLQKHPQTVQALANAGVPAHRAVMVGDTTFDMEMGCAALVATIGVSWGYHPTESLNADRIIHRFADLPGTIDHLLEREE